MAEPVFIMCACNEIVPWLMCVIAGCFVQTNPFITHFVFPTFYRYFSSQEEERQLNWIRTHIWYDVMVALFLQLIPLLTSAWFRQNVTVLKVARICFSNIVFFSALFLLVDWVHSFFIGNNQASAKSFRCRRSPLFVSIDGSIYFITGSSGETRSGTVMS